MIIQNIPYNLKPAKRIPASLEQIARVFAGVHARVPVRVIHYSTEAPHKVGRSYYWTTPSGETEVTNPKTYGWPTVYHKSTLAVRVGADWLPPGIDPYIVKGLYGRDERAMISGIEHNIHGIRVLDYRVLPSGGSHSPDRYWLIVGNGWYGLQYRSGCVDTPHWAVKCALRQIKDYRLQQRKLAKVVSDRTPLFVSRCDSLMAGNCEGGTDGTLRQLATLIGAEGPFSVRADVALSLNPTHPGIIAAVLQADKRRNNAVSLT